jgi:TetR/AcrR family transcriptional regulator, transcriptional repressor for nem operon
MKRTGNTKERILETARSLIWKHGYSHVTIDAICAETGIQKGSFYHFFENKAALAVEAFEAMWESYKPLLDELFTDSAPPLKRLQNYLRHLRKRQIGLKKKYGRVMGCPFCLLASELSQRNEAVGAKARAILKFYPKYLEVTLREAKAAGLVKLKNIRATVQQFMRLCGRLPATGQNAE